MSMIKASDISKYLCLDLIGDDIEVYGPKSIEDADDNCCVFLNEYNEEYLDALNSKKIMGILPLDYRGKALCPHVLTTNPRLTMARVINQFFYKHEKPTISRTAIVGDEVSIGENVFIGEYAVLEGKIIIGDGTYIGHHVRIMGDTTIGKNCFIKSGASIGEEGFGFIRDEDGINIHFPQVGGIEIGNGVFIGANSTVERAALQTTVIEDGVAIDDLTQVGHNVRLGKGSTIACGAVLCGGVKLGKRCSVAPNSCVRQHLTIGDDSIIGLGAVVVKDVPANSVFIGNPAKQMEK